MSPDELYILDYPHPALRQRARAVGDELDRARSIAKRMIALMREAEGIGLAAPQVGESARLFVAEVPGDEPGRSASDDPPSATDGPRVFIDPEIVSLEGPPEPFEEGCLSIPGVRGDVLRPPVVTVRARTEEGESFTLRAGGLLARCIQHEMDHLDGVLIIDRMTQMSRLKNRSAIRDLEREAGRR